MPLNDHVLLLQLERQYEALEDEVKAVVDTDVAYADHDHDAYAWDSHDHEGLYAPESRVDEMDTALIEAEKRIQYLDGCVEALRERIAALEKKVETMQDEVALRLIELLKSV